MEVNGKVYLLDKAAGITSRRAALAVAKANEFKKYGHCGTLDPDATGLLVVLLGKATRLAPYISGKVKRYSFDMVAGIETDTLDMSGKILREVDFSALKVEAVIEKLALFTGTFKQRVPLFSAVRVGGKRGYKLARQGETPTMPERSVTTSDWEAGRLSGNRISLAVTVSSGTYIRALARDIGDSLGIPAVADNIRRLSVGRFNLIDASSSNDSAESLLTMAEVMNEFPMITVTDHIAAKILHGNSFPASLTGFGAVLDSAGNLLAIGTGDGVTFQPKVVLASEVQQ